MKRALLFLLLSALAMPASAHRTLPHDHSTRGRGGDIGNVQIGCIEASNGACVLESDLAGVNVLDADAGTALTQIGLHDSTDTVIGSLSIGSATNEWLFASFINGVDFDFTGRNAGGVLTDMLRLDPDGDMDMYFQGTVVAETIAEGIEINGTLLDVHDFAASLDTGMTARSNAGGVGFNLSPTGQLELTQTNDSGVVEDIWMSATRNGGIDLRFNNSNTLSIVSGGVQITGNLDMLTAGAEIGHNQDPDNFYAPLNTADNSGDMASNANLNFFIDSDDTQTTTGYHIYANGRDEDDVSSDLLMRVSEQGALSGFHQQNAYKQSNETVTNSTTLQDDNDLVVTVQDLTDYKFELYLVFNSPAAADIAVSISCGGCSSVTGSMTCTGSDESGTAQTTYHNTVSEQHDFNTDGLANAMMCHGVLINPAGTGDSRNYVVQWAQLVADAGNTVMQIGSYWILEAIGT